MFRPFCSDAMKRAHGLVSDWMTAANAQPRLDAAGNLIGSFQGRTTSANERDVLLIGSHLDTVFNAGRFDGILGVMLGIGVIELLQANDIDLPFNIDAVGFSEEEGVRYNFPFIGSLGLIGQLDPGNFDRCDAADVRLGDALRQFGCDPNDLASASYFSETSTERPRRVIGFMEAHLEQATCLEESATAVGVVSTIAGQTRGTIVIEGVAGHAGTVPHDQRTDALAAAAELILNIESLGKKTEGLFATIGKVKATPGLSNVICGRVELFLDLRHADDEIRLQSLKTIELMLLELKRARGAAASLTDVRHSPAVKMDCSLTEHLNSAATAANCSTEPLVSGAGHDAMIMARAVPTCMLFVRCRDGVSHHPDEFVSPIDIEAALGVMTDAVIRIAASQNENN